MKFLAEAMHSIASDAAKSHERHPERQTIPLMDDDGLAVDPPDSRLNAEQQLNDDQECARIKRAVLDLFRDDTAAEMIVQGMIEDAEGEDLRAVTDLDKTAFASKRRFVRRQITKAFPEGWKP